MNLSYQQSKSTVKPLVLEFAKTTVYIRKDITSSTDTTDTGNPITMWTYQEAALTPEEFNKYSSQVMAENALKGVNDSANIEQIITGQETGDTNQLTIMEAIADLYDIIATMGS